MYFDRVPERENVASHGHQAVTVVLPPGTPQWITVELVRLTLKVWQKHYKEPLTIQDAVTIFLNAGQLFGILALE